MTLVDSTTARTTIGSRARLVLSVSLPRLARHWKEVLAWMETPDVSRAQESAARLAAIPGSEGLAVLAQLPEDMVAGVLEQSRVDEEGRSHLREIAARLTASHGSDSPRATLLRAFQGAADIAEDLEEQTLVAAPGAPIDAPEAESMPAMAAAVEAWQDDESAMAALTQLASDVVLSGAPLPPEFWLRAATRIPAAADSGRLRLLLDIAQILNSVGQPNRSLEILGTILPLWSEIGDVQGKAATLHNMARVIAQQGDVAGAMQLWNESLALSEKTGNAHGKAATLHQIAGVMARQGDVARAMELWTQSLGLLEQIGDVQGKAATLSNMAGVIALQGDVARAMKLWTQSLLHSEQIRDVRSKAATLHQMAGVINQQGDVARAMKLWNESLALKEQIGDVKGTAATLSIMAGVIAEQGDVARAMELWNQSLAIEEEVGNVRGKAATLSNMAGTIAQQGDVARAMELWNQSLGLCEEIGDVQGKAAALNNMAGVIAQQGDVARAMELWNQSLVLKEQIGDIQSKAATLSNMAGVIAQQGDVARAMELWNQSLVLLEQIGDVQGKAATLANMAWAAGKQGDAGRERELNLQAARALASVRAWLDAVTVLGNLGVSDDPEAAGFLAQALWLALRVEVPVDRTVRIAAALVRKVGVESSAALLAAAFGVWSARVRGQAHPKKEEIQSRAMGVLGACAEARGVTPEKFGEWLQAEGLNDPGRFLPALRRELEAIVGEGWVFDPAGVEKQG